MGWELDSIRLKELLDSPETVNVDWEAPSVSLDDREGEFSLTLYYENGSAVDMTLRLQISSDNINFADLAGTDQIIADNSGMHIWDISGSGALWVRARVIVAAGSIDVTRVFYAAKQRH